MRTTIHREGDSVWLEGVRGWSFHEKHSSIHAAQEAAMQAAGEEVAYDELVGVSGLAFRFQLSKKGFCPSSPHAFCGCKCVTRSTQSLPWRVRIFEAKPEDTAQVKAGRQAVVESIERGVPVQYGNEEDGIFIGYQRNGEEWICLHPLRDCGQKPFIETQWPWGLAVFTERKRQMRPRRKLAVDALRQAVTMANAGEAGTYDVGFKAWNSYIERLNAMDVADDRTRSEAMLGNAWIHECLAAYRASAARYLRAIAGEFDPAVATHLTRAADSYAHLSGNVLYDETHATAQIAPYPGGPDTCKFWTAEMRRDQVRRLEAALPLERDAVREVEMAVARMSNDSTTGKRK